MFFVLFLFILYVNIAFSDYPEMPFTDFIVVDGVKVPLKDGMNLSGKNLWNIQIGRSLGTLKNIDFSNSDMGHSDLRETNFENCNFNNTILVGAKFDGSVNGCSFVNADIFGTSIGGLNAEQLKSTINFKKKNLSYIDFNWYGCDFSGIDFSGMNLSHVNFYRVQFNHCKFDDAKINNSSFQFMFGNNSSFNDYQKFFDFRIEQLLSTKDFKEGFVENVKIIRAIWSNDKKIDLSKIVFVNCVLGSENQAKVDLTNSVISNCDFSNLKGLTLENVKSTWNYKHNRMKGIKLPEEIRKALDAEKL
jgi:uncharacterized protein YjbI with pentapeptide repeats